MLKHFTLVAALLAIAFAGGAAANAQVPPPTPSASAVPKASPKASPAPSPAASPTPTASPSPSPTPFRLTTFQGSADAGITAIEGAPADRFINGNPSRINDSGTGPYFDENGGRQLAGPNDFSDVPDLQNANISMTLNGSVFSGKIEGSFGSDAGVIASNGQTRTGANLTQAYAQATRGQFTLIAGKYESLAGAEVIEAPGNSNYSRDYLFGEAVPFTHTGVRATYAANSKISIIVGANNGWDDWKFAGKKATIEGGIAFNPSPAIALTAQTYNGNDFAINGNSALSIAPVLTNRVLYDSVLTVHATGALTLVANYDNGTQLADGTGAFQTAHWNGIAGYANYAFTPLYGISLRKETFHDTDGFRTGYAQRLQSNTATINYTPGNYIFRGEYRIDASDLPIFTYNGLPSGAPGRQHQSSLGFETIWKFP